MKSRYLFFIILIILCTKTFSQNYKSIFSSDTTIWNVYHCKSGAGETIVYYSYEDTIINLKTYHKLFKKKITEPGKPIFNGEIYGYVNEDTLTGQYLFFNAEDNEEDAKIFMDLSLNQGDTFNTPYIDLFLVNCLIADTIYFNEESRKIIDFKISDCIGSHNLSFIEGIGTSNGFYMNEALFAEEYSLICKYYNSELIYTTSSNINGNCYIGPFGDGINNIFLNQSIKIYPNPTNKTINVQLKDQNYKNLFYRLYNVFGELIITKKIEDLRFNIELIESGLFFIVITNGTNYYSEKILLVK